MELRCLVFSSDRQAAEPICHVLAELGGQAEQCPEAVAALEKVAKESFQIVIADWDQQPEAEFLLKAARGHRPNERPLILAIVADDAGVPKALQAGANSILRKPVLLNQVKETLLSARSLLAARLAPAAASAVATPSLGAAQSGEMHLRAGEFLQSTGPAPATQFDTESDMQRSMEQSAAATVDPLKELEPMAAAVTQEPPSAPSDTGPRGLEWYLKQRPRSLPTVPFEAAPAAPPDPPKPELIGYETMRSSPQKPAITLPAAPHMRPAQAEETGEQKAEAELFAYITGDKKDRRERGSSSFGRGKALRRIIAAAGILAVVAIAAAPQAPWHAQERNLWKRGRQAFQTWLNPQPVTPMQAPAAHEDFARAGDEYQLPVAENIPDATTDPSQIQVVPMVDPTAKKPNPGASADQATPADASAAIPAAAPSAPIQVTENSSPATPAPAPNLVAGAVPATGANASPVAATKPAVVTNPVVTPAPLPRSESAVSAAHVPSLSTAQWSPPMVVVPATSPAAQASSLPTGLSTHVISAPSPDSGTKPPDYSPPSIQPLEVPESVERGMLKAQPPIAYPANAKGLQGNVVLQVLIGPDGTVQDAKFLQGSLAFARAAIDGVKQWTFKPYIRNGVPVSVQTRLILNFRPGQ
jgi:protein TonB